MYSLLLFELFSFCKNYFVNVNVGSVHVVKDILTALEHCPDKPSVQVEGFVALTNLLSSILFGTNLIETAVWVWTLFGVG
jgi:hypothetical protein